MSRQLLYLVAALCIVGLSVVVAEVPEALSKLTEIEKDFTAKEKKDLENLTELILLQAARKYTIHDFIDELLKRHTGSTEGAAHVVESHLIKPCKKLLEAIGSDLVNRVALESLVPSEFYGKTNVGPFNSLVTIDICLELIEDRSAIDEAAKEHDTNHH